MSDNKVVCLPVKKSYEKHNLNNCDIDSVNTENMILQPLLDGTMINMFYHNDEWFICTRSNIGAKNSWDGKIPFNKMFKEIRLIGLRKDSFQGDQIIKKTKEFSYFPQAYFSQKQVSLIMHQSFVLIAGEPHQLKKF